MDAIIRFLDVKWIVVPVALAAHVSASVAVGAAINDLHVPFQGTYEMAASGLKGALAIGFAVFAATPLAKLADRYRKGY